jgi:hypothetical protein
MGYFTLITTFFIFFIFALLCYLFVDSLKLARTINNLYYYVYRPTIPYTPEKLDINYSMQQLYKDL